MKYQELGKTGMKLSEISLGTASLGEPLRESQLHDALRSVHVALERGVNYIDTSPFYGRGNSETMLGVALRDVPRDQYYLSSKTGRYDLDHFDFSPKRVQESIDTTLFRLGVDYLDLWICHDVEFTDLDYVINETLPEMRKVQESGKARFIGVSGYPLKALNYLVDRAEVDVVLSYNHFTLQNQLFAEMTPTLKEKGIGMINAAPFCVGLLTRGPYFEWHKASDRVKEHTLKACEYCNERGVDIAKLALQFGMSHPDMATCLTGGANPDYVNQWLDWAEEPMDEQLVKEVQEILQPVMNERYLEGLPENN